MNICERYLVWRLGRLECAQAALSQEVADTRRELTKRERRDAAQRRRHATRVKK